MMAPARSTSPQTPAARIVSDMVRILLAAAPYPSHAAILLHAGFSEPEIATLGRQAEAEAALIFAAGSHRGRLARLYGPAA